MKNRKNGIKLNLYITVFLLSIIYHPLYAQIDQEILLQDAKTLAAHVINDRLPDFVQLKYIKNKDNAETFALEYNFDSEKKWQLDVEKEDSNAFNFGGHGATFFALGNYSFASQNIYKDYAQAGGSYKKRWFSVKAGSMELNQEQNLLLQQCMEEGGFDVTVDDCREQLGFGRTELSYLYLDLDLHAKIEGTQDYRQNHYVYGLQTNISFMPARNSWLNTFNIFEYPARLLRGPNASNRHFPVFSAGLERIDPHKDKMRSEQDIKDTMYNRLFLQLAHTSPLGKIKNYPVKLNYHLRYFYEIDPPQAIKDKGLNDFIYYTIALQIPPAIIADLETDKGSIIISYSAGTLPFDHADEKIFELGWQSNYSLGDLF